MPHPRIKNSITGQKWPAIYYGLHMVPGVAEYADGPGGKPYRIFIGPDTAKKMDPSFSTKPMYVAHVDDEKPNKENKTIEGVTKDGQGNPEAKTADGYVIESFFNPADGMHWAKFIITSEEGVRAIERGDKLSNCYQPLNLGPGGEWHGVTYSREFVDAEYKHLAIVSNPRYKESLVFTPEQFSDYNKVKQEELAAMRNSADVFQDKRSQTEDAPMPQSKKSLLDKLFFRKTNKVDKVEPVENSSDIGKIEVAIGKGKTITIAQILDKVQNDLETDINDWDLNAGKDRPEHNEEELDVERPEHNKDEKDEKENDDEKDEKDNDDEETEEELKARRNRRKNKQKNGEKNTPADTDKANEDEEKDKKENDDELEDEKNDELEGSPLKHVLVMDGEETTVGDLIKDHMDLKGKHNALRGKHNALKEEFSNLCNKFGDDEAMQDDADMPEDETAMNAKMEELEGQEKALQNSLTVRQAQILKVIGKMKNATELKAARVRKEEESKQIFERLKNAEFEARLNKETPTVSTQTSMSMVERGKSRYGTN
jgi:hypothetical protein